MALDVILQYTLLLPKNSDIRGGKMSIFNSKFETYLLDQVFEIEEKENVQNTSKEYEEILKRKEYPEGFFSEL